MALSLAHFAFAANGSSSTTFTTGTFTSTTGNIMVAGVLINGNGLGSLVSVKNAAGTSFTLITGTTVVATGLNQTLALYLLTGYTGAIGDSVQLTITPGSGNNGVCVWEIYGAATTSPVDVVSTGRDTVLTQTTGAFTTTNANDIICVIAGVTVSGLVWTAQASPAYTLDGQFPTTGTSGIRIAAAEHFIFTSIQTAQHATMTNNSSPSSGEITMVTIKAAAETVNPNFLQYGFGY
jgi:hypothetical protein